ncbi:hypothetical protein FEM48_Zijuj03G0167800 [Ziziphus jujuba var. spinosa]|uniref:Vinorine synthase-like n=1 Tax=Ziziphus jujuba var. spinosa TaxID=714518 RepID=A0A978VRG8_ZIZJJ|nr:hypothetical protein FEM48_Zijuj03G0167800 [Ziziphus jujuba var. spinosa]
MVSLHHLKPYKLCLFDQLTPVTYPSLVFFYPIIAEHPNFNLPKTLTHLKNSLSETLTLFYPFSGRTKNNTLIHDFHVGCFLVDIRIAKDFGVGTRGEFEAENEAAAVVGCLEALGLFDDEFLESLEGEDGFLTISGFLNQRKQCFPWSPKSQTFLHSLVGIEVGAAFRNLIIFVDTQWGDGIEAWVTLEEKLMFALENDPNFLAFASPNPGVSNV